MNLLPGPAMSESRALTREVLERRELLALHRRVVPDHRVAVLEVVDQPLHLRPVAAE